MPETERRGYVTVTDDDGENYREIADLMTEMGWSMRHSSARNAVVAVMKKFVEAYAVEYGIVLTDDRASQIARDPDFQSSIADVLHIIEVQDRRHK